MVERFLTVQIKLKQLYLNNSCYQYHNESQYYQYTEYHSTFI